MWIRAVIVAVFLCLISSQAYAQDLCTHCQNTGCLETYEKAKSQTCKSCEICLKEGKRPVYGVDYGSEEEKDKNQTIINLGPNEFTIGGPLEKNETDEVKDCTKDKWKKHVECKDLEFQGSMSKSASWLLGFTGVQIFLSSLGLGGILLSLFLARRANIIAEHNAIIAKENADVAMQAVADARDRTRMELEPGLVVLDIVSLRPVMANEVNNPDGSYTEIRFVPMIKEIGEFWHGKPWFEIKLKVKNWGKLPIHDIQVGGTLSLSSERHNSNRRIAMVETPPEDGTITGHHDFIAPEYEDIIVLNFCYASFYSDRVNSNDHDPLSGNIRLILDDAFVYLMGRIRYKTQFTAENEIRELKFSWGSYYDQNCNPNQERMKVRMMPNRNIVLERPNRTENP